MDWKSDPKSPWLAGYRLLVLLFLLANTFLVVQGHHQIEANTRLIQAEVAGARVP